MHVKITIDPKRYMDGRITVMGVAAILITWFHCDVIITPGSLLELFKLTGDIGVDMFLFASGAGIYLAANKYPSYFEYLYRRVRRVLIPYLCVYVPVYSYERVMFGGGYSRFLKRILLLDFWLEGDLGNWYIAGILLLYIITPLWIKLWKKHRWVYAGTFSAVLVGYVFLRNAPGIIHWNIFLCRIPVYLLGLAFGKLLLEKRKLEVSLPLSVGAVLCGVVLILAAMGRLPVGIPGAYKCLAYLPVAVGLSLLFAKLPSNKFTNYFGVRSLEIYLVFETVQEMVHSLPQMEVFAGNTKIMLAIFSLTITLVAVEILCLLCKLIDKTLDKMVSYIKK